MFTNNVIVFYYNKNLLIRNLYVRKLKFLKMKLNKADIYLQIFFPLYIS
jgi:hypothetical protein